MTIMKKCNNCGDVIFQDSKTYVGIYGRLEGTALDVDYCSLECLEKHLLKEDK